MTTNAPVPLACNLYAHYFTHAQIAPEKRRQARKNAKHNENQLELDEEN
jgi:hypothetical protein